MIQDTTKINKAHGIVYSAESTFGVCKIQLPLLTNGEPMALVYNANRSFEMEISISKPLRKFMGGEPKKFAFFDFEDGVFNINGEAPWEDW